MAFEHRYRFSIDEEIIPRYDDIERVKFLFETRTNFIVKHIDGVERIIDSERFASYILVDQDSDGEEGIERYSSFFTKEVMDECMGLRLKDYWMPGEIVKRLIDEVMIFAKQIVAGGRRGRIPVAVDVEVCTVQQEGEGIEATADRAMRPEFLPPPYLYPIDYSANPGYEMPVVTRRFSEMYLLLLELESAAIRVEDVEKGLGVMEVCSICGRQPMIGTQICPLRCGHAFHHHCIVKRLENDLSCPICRCPARDPDPIFGSRLKLHS